MSIEQIIIISLAVFGYCCVFWEGMIFERVGYAVRYGLYKFARRFGLDYYKCEAISDNVWMPLGGCYICAVPWVGSIIYYICFYLPDDEWYIWPGTLLAAMGINALVSKFIDRKDQDNERKLG